MPSAFRVRFIICNARCIGARVTNLFCITFQVIYMKLPFNYKSIKIGSVSMVYDFFICRELEKNVNYLGFIINM